MKRFSLFLGLLLLICGCDDPSDRKRVEKSESVNPARFEKVKRVILEYQQHGDLTGTVYKDRETEIEYLYIWDGAGNGGPAITRLWKKGE